MLDFKKMKKEELVEYIKKNDIGNSKSIEKLMEYEVNLTVKFFNKVITNHMVKEAIDNIETVDNLSKDELIKEILEEEARNNGGIKKVGLEYNLQTKSDKALRKILQDLRIGNYIKENF